MDRLIEIFGHEKIFEFMYVITVTLVGIFLLIIYNTKNKKISDALLSGLAIFIAGILHMLYIKHDSIVYYHIYGKLEPLEWDFGYALYLMFIGVIYTILILTSAIIFFIKWKES